MTDCTAAPDLETERLLLRHFTADDFSALVACWQHPDVVRYIGGMPQSAEMTWGRLLRYLGHWMVEGYGYWAVMDKASGSFIGAVGLQSMRREIEPPLAWPEAGWTLMPEWHGRGFAFEAMSEVMAWADRVLPGPLCCIIDTDNQPSIALAERLGFQAQSTRIYHDKPVGYYQRG